MELIEPTRSLAGYQRELSQVPQALEEFCNSVNSFAKPIFTECAKYLRQSEELFVFGMASSQWASWPMVCALERRGTKVRWMSAYDGLQLPKSRFCKRSVVLVVSQSCETAEVQLLVERIRLIACRPPIITVTNVAAASTPTGQDMVIDIMAGPEIHAPSKTYVNTLATLLVLYSFFIQSERVYQELIAFLENIASLIRAQPGHWSKWGNEVATGWAVHRGPLQFLATGPQMASAWQASMLCSETARVFSAVGDWATFRHGFEPQVSESFIAVGFRPHITKNSVWRTTSQSIRNRGGKMFPVPEPPDKKLRLQIQRWLDQDLVSTVWETLPIHWLCISLANCKQLDASQIERKVTRNL